MFASASLFQSRVEYWNTSKITDMSVSAVLKMNTYFSTVTFLARNVPIPKWPSVQNQSKGMFQLANIFDADVSNWNTSNVEDMSVSLLQNYAYNVCAFEIIHPYDFFGVCSHLTIDSRESLTIHAPPIEI